MKRRAFAKLAGLSVVAVSTTGFVRFNGKSYEGDCETTTDILGPFYRPNSPERTDLVIAQMPGDIVELSGIVRHKDCRTPYKDAKVELWHCSSEEIYDNDSDEYRYRGTTYCDEHGRYAFRTQMPVPYDAGGGLIRPAHFHLMVSAPGYQSLVTQIYFQGDRRVKKDPWAGAEKAEYRRVNVENESGVKRVLFDCTMNDQLKASFASIKQIVGTYQSDRKNNTMEFFERDGLLWKKNEVFGNKYDYIGENTFEYGGMPDGSYTRLHFDLKKDSHVDLTVRSSWKGSKEKTESFVKI